MVHDMIENSPGDQLNFLDEVQNQTGMPLPVFLRHYRQLVIDVNKQRAYMQNPSPWIPHCFSEEIADSTTVQQLYLDIVVNTSVRRPEIQDAVRHSIAADMERQLERAIIEGSVCVDHADPNPQSMTSSTVCFPPVTMQDIDSAQGQVEEMRDRAITWGVPAPLLNPQNTMKQTFDLLRGQIGMEAFHSAMERSFLWATQMDRGHAQHHRMIPEAIAAENADPSSGV